MPETLRVAVLLGGFPSVSETFILRQITGLLDLGHEIDIYAERRPEPGNSMHPEVAAHGLLERTTFLDIPDLSGFWEQPVRPILGRTWTPGTADSTLNWIRVLRAIPTFLGSFVARPRLTLAALSKSQFGYQAESLSTLYRLAELAKRARSYDVIHAHYGPVGSSFRFARRLWNSPLVVSFHGYDFSTVPAREGRDVYHHLFEQTDAVTANSDYMRAGLERIGCPSTKLHRLAYGLKPDLFPFRIRTLAPGERVRILSVARLTEKKGLEFSLRAVALLAPSAPLRYDIIGDGPKRPEIERLIHELKLDDIVTLHGAKDEPFVQDMLSQAHLFVLASVTAADGDQEGTPVALLEAQACGLPVLSTRHSGIPEVVRDGYSGFLVAERDVEGLADNLKVLITHSEMWPDMGRNGRAYIEAEHDIANVTRDLVRVYEIVVAFARAGVR